MLKSKIYQFIDNKTEVSIYLRDQHRWIEYVQIISLEGDLVTLQYEMEDDEEISSCEEIIRIDSIGSISQQISTLNKLNEDIYISDDCPETEKI